VLNPQDPADQALVHAALAKMALDRADLQNSAHQRALRHAVLALARINVDWHISALAQKQKEG
jgi:hypothetical protein